MGRFLGCSHTEGWSLSHQRHSPSFHTGTRDKPWGLWLKHKWRYHKTSGIAMGFVSHLRFKMFLCSNSSAVGLWLSRLRKKSRKSFWTMSYLPWVINLPSPRRCRRQSQWLEFLFHPGLWKTDFHHQRLLSSSISSPGKVPYVMSRWADPPPSSLQRLLPSPVPLVPPGKWTLLFTEVPFFPRSLLTLGPWPLSLSPNPEARACFLPSLCRPS